MPGWFGRVLGSFRATALGWWETVLLADAGGRGREPGCGVSPGLSLGNYTHVISQAVCKSVFTSAGRASRLPATDVSGGGPGDAWHAHGHRLLESCSFVPTATPAPGVWVEKCSLDQLWNLNHLKHKYNSKVSLLFSRSAVSDSLRPRGLQHARPPCPSPTPGACSDSCPLRW